MINVHTISLQKNFDLTEIEDASIGFVFSFGVFCHLPADFCERYIAAIAPKLRPGAHGFLSYAYFDKYNNRVDRAEQVSIKRLFAHQTRKVWLPMKLAFLLTWNLFRPKIDSQRVSKREPFNLANREGEAGWYHWGIDAACAALERQGLHVIERDVDAVQRDPITHFVKVA